MPYFGEEDIEGISQEVVSILRSGRLILGPYVKQFEESFAAYCGVKWAVAVSSCTAALEITLRYFGIAGGEVILPTNTFVATGNAVLFAGGTPMLADIRPDTLCLDPDEVRGRITPRTKGIIVVHLAGLPCPDIDEIKTVCRERGLFLLEDAAHAHGAMIDNRKTGSIGDAGCFSFYPTKVMTTCTGGMITTNDHDLAEYAVSLRHHGVGTGLHDIVNLGNDWLMDEISAILGIYQLKSLERNIEKRNRIGRQYSEALVGCEWARSFKVSLNVRHSYYKYPVLLAPSVNKEKLVHSMRNEYDIEIGSAYDPPCHLQPLYHNLLGYHLGMFPQTEETLKQTCSLPIHPGMSDSDVEYVIESFMSLAPKCRMEKYARKTEFTDPINTQAYPS